MTLRLILSRTAVACATVAVLMTHAVHAAPVPRFANSLDLHFAPRSDVLAPAERARLDAHLVHMAQRGECVVETIFVVGSGGEVAPPEMDMRPRSRRGEQLQALLRKHGFDNLIFVRREDGPRADADTVSVQFLGLNGLKPCIVR